METNLCQICIQNSQVLLTVLVDYLLNIMKKIQTFRETENLRHLYRNELDKVCFAHDAAYSYSKDLAQKTISDKV